jgi:hypothetical protein
MAARNEHACDTPPLFTSPTNFQQTVQSTFQRTRRLRRRGLAASPPCTQLSKQKNLPRVYDMRHNFASHRLFILHDLISENAKTTARARAKAADAVRRGGNARTCGILAMLFGESAEARHLLGEQQAGVFYFVIRRHGHHLSSGIAPYVAPH